MTGSVRVTRAGALRPGSPSVLRVHVAPAPCGGPAA